MLSPTYQVDTRWCNSGATSSQCFLPEPHHKTSLSSNTLAPCNVRPPPPPTPTLPHPSPLQPCPRAADWVPIDRRGRVSPGLCVSMMWMAAVGGRKQTPAGLSSGRRGVPAALGHTEARLRKRCVRRRASQWVHILDYAQNMFRMHLQNPLSIQCGCVYTVCSQNITTRS